MRWNYTVVSCAILLGASGTASACHRKGQDAGSSTVMAGAESSPAPIDTSLRAMHIDALVPDSARSGPNRISEIIIRGRGFRPAGSGTHVVHIGMIELHDVPANASGTEIRVVIPDRASVGGGPPRPIFPGNYAVIVSTERDTSNAVTLRVLP